MPVRTRVHVLCGNRQVGQIVCRMLGEDYLEEEFNWSATDALAKALAKTAHGDDFILVVGEFLQPDVRETIVDAARTGQCQAKFLDEETLRQMVNPSHELIAFLRGEPGC